MRYHRSSFSITLSVWKALFLREALSRFFSGRAALFWLIAEPLFHIAYLVIIYTVIRVHKIGGIDTGLWVVVGMMSFFFFRRTSEQVTNAINSNQALFAYRQVKPIDTALVRAGLEGFVMLMIVFLVLFIMALLGHHVIPVDPAKVMLSVFAIWIIGIGFGLISSVIEELAPELGKIIDLIMKPLYMISGVILPISSVPEPYHSWLLVNPLAHGVELTRLGFVSYYHAAPNVSMGYLFGFALVIFFFGLVLQRRFALRLMTQ